MFWLVVPTYNEVENVAPLVASLLELPLPLIVLIVDDASPDGTGQLAEQLRQSNSMVQVLHRTGKQGLGSAYRAGFAHALASGATVVGEMDADFSHTPSDVPRLMAALEQGADVAIGSRRVQGGRVVGWGPWRHLTSWGAMTISRLTLGLQTKDVTAGFRLYKAAALARVPWQKVASDGYAFQEEILFLCERAGLKIAEVPVTFVDRTRGKSKLSVGSITEFFTTMWRLRRRRG